MDKSRIMVKDEPWGKIMLLESKKSVMKPRILLALLFVVMAVLLSGCQKNMNYKDTAAFTFDGAKVNLSEMMYHVLLAKMQEELYTSYMKEDNQATDQKEVKELSKALTDAAIDNAVKYQLFYGMALNKNYSLTEEEKAECLRRAENIQKNFGEETLNNYGLTIEDLTAIQEKIALATRYYSNYIDSFSIDKEAIRNNLDIADYKQYKINYLFGQKTEKELLTELRDKALTEDFKELSEEAGIKSGDLTFFAGKDTFGEEKILEDTVISMKEGEVSEVIETVNGFYILKLISESSKDAFEKAVEEEYEKERNEAAEAGYQSLKADHEIELNKDLQKVINR